VEARTVDATALRALGRQAHGASLLVIGRHRPVPGPDVVLGATDRGLVESAPCSVLVVGHPRRALSDSAAGPQGDARTR
jgi:nucleotide-binding universal stress UspA family protein